MRENFPSVLVLLLAGLLAGCGDFWVAPGSTGTSTGTTTTTTLTSSTSTPTEGASVTLTATVTPAAATGTVTFYDNSASIGTGTLTAGTASLSTAFTTTGAQSLTASYGGSSTYASSTSSVVSLTVSAATTSARTQLAASPAATGSGAASNSIQTTGYGSSPIHAISSFQATGGSYTAQNGEAVVVEGGGSLTLNGTALSSAAGAGHGILFSNSSPSATPQNPARFTMTGGSITYNCPAAELGAACAQAASAGGQSDPATAFSVANAKAAISLTDVAVTNNTGADDNRQGTLLVAAKQDAAGDDVAGDDVAGDNVAGDNVTFTARGTTMTGNVLVDGSRTAALSLLQDDASTGSSLTGAINQANTAKAVSLTLDGASTWTVTATSYVTKLSGLDVSNGTVNNVDGGGHCVYYSGSVDGASDAAVYALSGGGFLAPRGTTGLACE